MEEAKDEPKHKISSLFPTIDSVDARQMHVELIVLLIMTEIERGKGEKRSPSFRLDRIDRTEFTQSHTKHDKGVRVPGVIPLAAASVVGTSTAGDARAIRVIYNEIQQPP